MPTHVETREFTDEERQARAKVAIGSTDLMRRLGIGRVRLSQLKAEGMPCAFPSRLASMEDRWIEVEARAWCTDRGYLSGGAHGYLDDPRVSVDLKEEVLKARLDKERALVAKHEHFLKVARSEVISREAYTR